MVFVFFYYFFSVNTFSGKYVQWNIAPTFLYDRSEDKRSIIQMVINAKRFSKFRLLFEFVYEKGKISQSASKSQAFSHVILTGETNVRNHKRFWPILLAVQNFEILVFGVFRNLLSFHKTFDFQIGVVKFVPQSKQNNFLIIDKIISKTSSHSFVFFLILFLFQYFCFRF